MIQPFRDEEPVREIPPGRALPRALWSALRGRDRAAVLMYHRVHPEPDVLSVSPERFAAHVRFLREYCHPISLSELVRALEEARPLPAGAVVLTFDDGYRDNFTHAYPILAAHGVPATFFVTTGLIDERRHFWWDRVRLGLKEASDVVREWPAIAPALEGLDRHARIARVTEALKRVPSSEARDLIERITFPVGPAEPVTMSRDDLRVMARHGMEIGSHTVTHPILSQQSPEEGDWEVIQSKRDLESQLGLPVMHFAYPNGRACDFSARLMRTLQEAGYASACSTVEGVVTPRSTRFSLERIGVYQDMPLSRLVLKLLATR